MSFMLVAAFTYLIDVNGYKNFKMSQVLEQTQYYLRTFRYINFIFIVIDLLELN